MDSLIIELERNITEMNNSTQGIRRALLSLSPGETVEQKTFINQMENTLKCLDSFVMKELSASLESLKKVY